MDPILYDILTYGGTALGTLTATGSLGLYLRRRRKKKII